MAVDKAKCIAELLHALRAELAAVTQSQRTTQQGAIDPESRAENAKDTRGLESSYLARGLAQRVIDLREGVDAVSALATRSFAGGAPIALTALITLEDDAGTSTLYLMAPAGGGLKLHVDGAHINVVTPISPLGRALLGQTTGADVQLRTPKGANTYAIVDVQ